MASSNQTSKSLPYPITFVIGLALAVAGFYMYNHVKIAALETLKEDGIAFDPGKSIATIGVLIIVFPLIKGFFIKPLQDAIHDRTENLENTFSEAEALRTEMTTMKSDYEKRLAATEANAREQIQAQIREAQQLRDTLRSEAVMQAEDYKRKAISEIEAEKAKVVNDLRLHVVNLTLQAAEKVVGENMDSDRNRKLVEDFIDKVEAPV